MYHYVYKTVNPINKKFYIGKHSTNSLQDDYQGSGLWVKNCKKFKTHLITGIISFCDTEEQAYKLEENILKKYFNDKLNMNFKYGGLGNRSEDMRGQNNVMYGRSAITEKKLKWYTDGKVTIYVTEGTQPEGFVSGRQGFKHRISRSVEHRKKISLRNLGKSYLKGYKYKIRKCPHCDVSGGGGNMTLHHFNNCRSKI